MKEVAQVDIHTEKISRPWCAMYAIGLGTSVLNALSEPAEIAVEVRGHI